MSVVLRLLCISLLVVLSWDGGDSVAWAGPAVASDAARVQVWFPPRDDAEGALADWIDGARRQVLVQAYLFTNRKLAAALARAAGRGVRVEVIVDAQQAKGISGPRLEFLKKAGVAVFLDAEHASAHDKIILVDPEQPGGGVATGSMNFTWSGQHKNAENLLLLRDAPAILAAYLANWRAHRAHSRPW